MGSSICPFCFENDSTNNNQVRINRNEDLLSFVERIFPKRDKNKKSFSYQIPPNTEGSFITDISENITFTEKGQFIEVKMNLLIVNLSSNAQYSGSFGINFESQIYDVHCNLKNKYECDSHHIKFYYILKNNENLNIEFDYKKYSPNICEYYRSEFILISNIFAGAIGKYKVNIPEKYILICEENEIFYPEDRNTFIWEGVIPKDGLKEWFKISYKKAKWQAQVSQEMVTKNPNDNINLAQFIIPKYYKGGNLDLEKYEIRCSLGIGVDNKSIFEEENKYKILIENVASNKVFFQIITTFRNNVLSYWKVSEEDEKQIIQIDNETKNLFKQIAEQIIKEDKSNNPIFDKFRKFVYKHIKYDKSYSGKDMSAIEIYNRKKGVCEHYTILFNTLLNSIDIPAIYVSGLANNGEGGKTQIKDTEKEGHAWTLAKIDGRWIPLDATWGILKGILPVSHIFQNYFRTKIKSKFSENIKVLELQDQIAYLRE